jgi:hypothetical protein
MEKHLLRSRLQQMQEEQIILLQKHKDKHFENEETGKKYIEDNKTELQRLNELQQEISEIKWQLMTNEEKKSQVEYYHKLKEKYAED